MLRELVSLIALTGAATTASGAAAARPNVVLIISDDQAWTDFGFQGHPEIETPHLDRLAREGLLFRRGYVTASLCRPSLLSIATGLYPHQHGVTGNDPRPGVDRSRLLDRVDVLETLPRVLGRHGYRSLQTGKWWEGSFARGGFTDGMTHGDPTRGGRHGDEGLSIGRSGLAPIRDFLDERAADGAPFFLWYAPFLPHLPHNPPDRWLDRYRVEGRPESIARYFAMCSWFDETCGELLGELDTRGVADDTLVVFVTDNGWIQRDDGSGYAPRSKRSPYEGGVRTPIMLRWPSRLDAADIAAPVSSVDIAPTLLWACGAPVPDEMSGSDLIAVAGGDAPRRREVFGATFDHDVPDVFDPARGVQSRYVVDGRWKLIASIGESRSPELYDLEDDPHERTDLAAAEPARVAAMRDRLDRWWRPDPPARPNFLFVITDDQRADALGAVGHPFLQTPAMDGLAARGIRFRNAFVTTSICAASRASLLTGMVESRHRFTFGTPPIARSLTRDSYPALLRAAGYRTGFVGKWGVKVEAGVDEELWDEFTPLSQPYQSERSGGEARHLTDRVADRAIEFLRATGGGVPFSLTVCFHAPHAEDANPDQYVWPARLDGLYDDQDVPRPDSSDPAFFAALPVFQRESLNRERWFWRFDDELKRQRMTRGYLRMITGVDQALSRILAALEQSGHAKDTVVIFTSDNGYFLGERGFAGKWTIHEPSIRVPLIVMDPRAAADRAGTIAAEMALNIDLSPTLLDLAGVPTPTSCQGRSLVPVLRGESPEWRDDFFYEHRFDHPKIPECEGVRSSRFVYVRYPEQEPVYEELYDLAADPREERDLARDPTYAAELHAARARCDELKRLAASPPP